MRLVAVRAVATLVLALIVASSIPAIAPLRAQATNPYYSTVSISPVTTCCSTSSGPPYQPNDRFNVTVNLDLLAGEEFNAFDVRVNYTNPHAQTASGPIQGVLQAMSIDYSNNIFQSFPHNVLASCIDGNVYGVAGSAGACAPDSVGQVHLAEVFQGPHNITGPASGQLFTITFNVTGVGLSVIAPERTQFITPGSFYLIPFVGEDAIFGNQKVVPFFTFKPNYPSDTIVSPSLLQNQSITFDASSTYVAYDRTIGFKSYLWKFGDGTTGSGVTVDHTYAQNGNYSVSLTAVDNNNENANLTRTAVVLPALGALDLTVDDSSGTPQSANVQVSIFNSSSSPNPFKKKTTSQVGNVTFSGLTPGDYYLTFSGPGFISSSKTETVIAGFTRTDTIYLTGIPKSPDYSGIVYIVSILGGLGAVVGALIYQRRKSGGASAKGRGQSSIKPKTSKSFRDSRRDS